MKVTRPRQEKFIHRIDKEKYVYGNTRAMKVLDFVGLLNFHADMLNVFGEQWWEADVELWSEFDERWMIVSWRDKE